MEYVKAGEREVGRNEGQVHESCLLEELLRMAKPGGDPSCQGVSLQGRGRQKDRPRDFPCPLGFVFYSLSFSFYSPAVFILPCLSTGAGHGPKDRKSVV